MCKTNRKMIADRELREDLEWSISLVRNEAEKKEKRLCD